MRLTYITFVFRHLGRHKLFSIINIGGLAFGLAAFWMIALYIGNELNYDTYSANADRIFRVAQHEQWDGGNFDAAITPAPFASAMKSDFSEVEQAVRIDAEGGGTILYGSKQFQVGDLFLTDSNFFKVFDFKFISGDAATALSNPQALVITRALAVKIFGDVSNALNKSVDLGSQNMVVSAVMEDVPVNSHFSFSGLHTMPVVAGDSWKNSYLYTYLLLRDPADREKLAAKLPGFFERHLKPFANNVSYRAELQPLTSIHLYSNLAFEINPNGKIRYVYIFSLVAALILIIASINYMNLSTALSSLRVREIGIRKVTGSSRVQLMGLFLAESVVVTLIASVVSIALLNLATPWFEAFVGMKVNIWSFGAGPTLCFLIGFSLLAGSVSGIYPALLLSGFKLIPALKGQTGNHDTNVAFRQLLVVFQFVITTAMIAGSLIVQRQLQFVFGRDLGFNKDQVITFHLNNREIRDKVQTIREQLLQNPLVEDVATAGNPIGNNNIGGHDYKIDGDAGTDGRPRMANYFTIDEDFIPTMQIKVEEGRNFSRNSSDASDKVIINETLSRSAGWNKAVGRKIQMGVDTAGRPLLFEVAGVVKDFNIYSLQHKVEPLLLQLPQRASEKDNMYVRLSRANLSAALQFTEATFKKFDPAGVFEYSFLDENFGRQYKTEEMQGNLLLIFTTLAISIGCLGLFGLITFTSELRRKEIGIRKVLGGTVQGIVFLLAKDLMKLVTIAIIIAIPVASWLMNLWLADFAYHITIEWWILGVTCMTVLLVALVTVSLQVVQSATANPVESLRLE